MLYMTYTIEQIKAIGGQPWIKPGDDTLRYYLNNWADLIDLDVERYKTGNIKHATLAGQRISNSKAGRLLAGRVYWEDGQIHVTPPLAIYADEIAEAVAAKIARVG